VTGSSGHVQSHISGACRLQEHGLRWLLISGALVIRSGQLPGLASTTACGMERQIPGVAQAEHAVGS
jgi:hypothetical protein